MFTVSSSHTVGQLLTHHPARLPHNDAALARLVLIIQEVVDAVIVGVDQFPYLLTPHLCYTAVQEAQQVTERS